MIADSDPNLEPEAGWQVLPPLPSVHRSFVSGDPDGDRLRVRYSLCDGAFVGKVWFGPGAEGPPGHAHGGSMAAVLDEAMGGAAWLSGHKVLAVKLETSFRRMVPLGSVLVITTKIRKVDGRKVFVEGNLSLGDTVFCEGLGTYLELQPDRTDAPGEAIQKAMGILGEK